MKRTFSILSLVLIVALAFVLLVPTAPVMAQDGGNGDGDQGQGQQGTQDPGMTDQSAGQQQDQTFGQQDQTFDQQEGAAIGEGPWTFQCTVLDPTAVANQGQGQQLQMGQMNLSCTLVSQQAQTFGQAGGPGVASPSAGVQEPGGNTYTVQSGDTLSEIARQYGTTSQAIASANNIQDLNQIIIGQSLTIPMGQQGFGTQSGAQQGTQPGQEGQQGLAAPITPGVEQQDQSGAAATGQNTYTVQAGDTLSEIALQYGTTYQAIASANNIQNPDQISIGQSLTFPMGQQDLGAQDQQDLAAPTTSGVQDEGQQDLAAPPTTSGVQDEDQLDLAAPTTSGVQDEDQPDLAAPTTSGVQDEDQPDLAAPTTSGVEDEDQQDFAAVTGQTTYTVQPGDTLNSIALQYNVPLDMLASANNIQDTSIVRPGQQLIIPSGQQQDQAGQQDSGFSSDSDSVSDYDSGSDSDNGTGGDSGS